MSVFTDVSLQKGINPQHLNLMLQNVECEASSTHTIANNAQDILTESIDNKGIVGSAKDRSQYDKYLFGYCFELLAGPERTLTYLRRCSSSFANWPSVQTPN